MRHLVRQARLEAHFEIDSAGTAAYHSGEPPDSRSTETARRRGIALGGKARQFRREDFARFDYVLAMDRNNHAGLLELARSEDERAKVSLLRDFEPDAGANASVPDPYYGGESGFEEVVDICLRACAGLLAHVRKEREI
jgi:protein-tyrosine phosphatase